MASAEGPLARIGELARARARQAARSKASAAEPISKPAHDQVRLEDLEPVSSNPDMQEGLPDSSGDVLAATEQVAMQQELTILRRMLQEKERLVDATSEKCRSLEDELEDQRLAYDSLTHDMERGRLADDSESAQAAPLVPAWYEIQDGSEQPSNFGKDSLPSELPVRGRHRVEDQPSQSGTRSKHVIALGALAAVFVSALWIYLGSGNFQAPQPEAQDSAAVTVTVSGQSADKAFEEGTASAAEVQVGPSAEIRPDGATLEGVKAQARTVSSVPATIRDRLRDGSAGPLMARIQGGSFSMGKPRNLPSDDAAPQHTVNVKNFLMGSTEVTFAEYERFARATGRRMPNDYGWGRGPRPVVGVSWDDAQAYAKWLSVQTKRRYRLPSEAEWEYAAGAGTRSSFWWGYKPEQNRAVCFDCGSQWDKISTAPVGSFEPNPFGLYDITGNVMEWVQDCYHSSYEGAPADGGPRESSACGSRVARGGAFNKPARSMRTTSRHHFAPKTSIDSLGFRLARDD